MSQRWRDRLAGVWLLGLAAALGAGLAAHLWPEIDTFVSTNMRMADSLRPHLLVLGAGLALGLVFVGPRWLIGPALGAALLGAGVLVVDYQSRIAPAGTRTDLTVLWFNAFYENPIAPEQLEAAFRASGADIIAIGEANPALPAAAALRDLYPHMSGCRDPAACGILILSKYPLGQLAWEDLPSGPGRFVTFWVAPPGRRATAIFVAHLVKPWYLGLAGAEKDTLFVPFFMRRDHPLVVMGDFNAAPWSRRMRELEQLFGLTHPPQPLPTWPVGAGPLGVPIDHVLLRGEAALSGIETWGQGLGSNHLGLLARIEIAARQP